MNRTMRDNDLNLGSDAASAAVAMSGIATAALRRPHLMRSITAMGWVAKDVDVPSIVVQCSDAGAALHLANALGFPAGEGAAARRLPRLGEISGIPVIITDEVIMASEDAS